MSHTIRTSYKYYKEKKEESDVEIGLYAKINSLFCKFMAEQVLEGEEIALPKRFGKLMILGKKESPRLVNGKIVGLSPNWPRTKELWDRDPEAKEQRKIVYNTNEHSDGYRYRCQWSKKNVFKQNKNLYSFKLTRANKRALMERIKNNKEYLIK